MLAVQGGNKATISTAIYQNFTHAQRAEYVGRFVIGKGRKTHVSLRLLPPHLAVLHLADIMSPYFLDDDDLMYRLCMEYLAGRPVPDDFVPPPKDRMREIICEGIAKFLVLGKVPILEFCEEVVEICKEGSTDPRRGRISKNLLALCQKFLDRRIKNDLPRLLAAGQPVTPENDLTGVNPTLCAEYADRFSLQNGLYDTETAQQPLMWNS
jgi:hypothetical protein